MAKNIITWEENIYKKKTHKITVEFPVCYVSQYGYYCYSKDGKTTIQIGLNGIICKADKTHSIEVHDYFSGEGYLKRKKELSLIEWREALNTVKKQIDEFIKATL